MKTKLFGKFRDKLIVEHAIMKLGFKEKWLSDKSGYWFEKTYAFPVYKKITVTIDTDNKRLLCTVRDRLHYYTENDVTYCDASFKYKTFLDIKNYLKKANLK